MSLQAQRAVNASQLEPWLRRLAFALAFYAKKDGTSIYPNIRTIAKTLGLKKRQVYYGIRALVDLQILIRGDWHYGYGTRTRCYRLDLAQLAAYQPTEQQVFQSAVAPVDQAADRGFVISSGAVHCTPKVQPTALPILISDLKKDLKNLLACPEVPVSPVRLAVSNDKPSKPSPAEAANDEDRKGTAEIEGITDDFLSIFKKLYFEQRGEPYRQRTSDRDKACELALTHEPADLVEMVRTMLSEDAGGDPWVANSDRSLSVLYHRAGELFKLVKQPKPQPLPSPGVEWGAVLTHLKGKLPSWQFHQWFGSTHQAACVGPVLHVAVDCDEQRAWIRRHYTAQLQAALVDANIGVSRVEFVILARRPDVEWTG